MYFSRLGTQIAVRAAWSSGVAPSILHVPSRYCFGVVMGSGCD